MKRSVAPGACMYIVQQNHVIDFVFQFVATAFPKGVNSLFYGCVLYAPVDGAGEEGDGRRRVLKPQKSQAESI